MKYFIKTFGCQQNLADSERLAGYYERRGYTKAHHYAEADVVVINTCVVRQKAEDKVYGLLKNLASLKEKNAGLKVVLTGCLVGTAVREPSGRLMRQLKERLGQRVDELLPIEEVGFDYEAVRADSHHAWVPISNGCNNFCTFCIVPFSRGREVSRPFQEIVREVEGLVSRGYGEFTLLGQNVNSYGADLVSGATYSLEDGRRVKPVMVKHLGRQRIPTLFPYLLERLCQTKGVDKISFIASNPWDFSDELIETIARYPQVDRVIHLPVQSGDDAVLKKMNRWYTRGEYLGLIAKIWKTVPDVSFTTDLIVGFPGETGEAFQNTVDLARQVGFVKAFIACYSPRPGTAAEKTITDDVAPAEKKRRFRLLDQLINHQPDGTPIAWIRRS